MYTPFLTDGVALNFSTGRDLMSNRPFLSQFEELVDEIGTDRKRRVRAFDRYQDRRATLQTANDMDGSK